MSSMCPKSRNWCRMERGALRSSRGYPPYANRGGGSVVGVVRAAETSSMRRSSRPFEAILAAADTDYLTGRPLDFTVDRRHRRLDRGKPTRYGDRVPLHEQRHTRRTPEGMGRTVPRRLPRRQGDQLQRKRQPAQPGDVLPDGYVLDRYEWEEYPRQDGTRALRGILESSSPPRGCDSDKPHPRRAL